jgi:transcriptional regulator with XRE-family HTH domain
MSTGLRELRTQKGVSIRELERRTGINRGRLSQLERGIPPTPDELERYVLALVTPPGSAAAA